MADQEQQSYERTSHGFNTDVEGNHEVKERGMFDFLGKKEDKEKPQDQEQVIVTEFEKAQLTDSHEDQRKQLVEEEKKPSLMEKLHRSHSSSSTSSSSDEGEGEGEKKKKKEKKGLKEKICEEHHEEGTHVVPDQEEKKGFIEQKITEKVSGAHKGDVDHHDEGEAKEKKGILEKIKEKLPGHHQTGEEKENETAGH